MSHKESVENQGHDIFMEVHVEDKLSKCPTALTTNTGSTARKQKCLEFRCLQSSYHCKYCFISTVQYLKTSIWNHVTCSSNALVPRSVNPACYNAFKPLRTRIHIACMDTYRHISEFCPPPDPCEFPV